MKISRKALVKNTIGGIVTLAVLAAFWQFVVHPHMPWTPDPSLNPDKSHTHADFAVWINGNMIDFTDNKYMSGVSYSDASHDEEGEYLHQFLHLHDNLGHVIHRHKPGLDLAEFFGSIGFDLTDACLTTDAGVTHCTEGGDKEWKMFVNGTEHPFDPGYVFSDLDSILLTYGSSEKEIKALLRKMSDDACLYSKACPWRGEPPAENCIADPSIPCGGSGLTLEDSLL